MQTVFIFGAGIWFAVAVAAIVFGDSLDFIVIAALCLLSSYTSLAAVRRARLNDSIGRHPAGKGR